MPRRPKDLSFSGYELQSSDSGLSVRREKIDTTRRGDYGADPLGDGTFRMVPSGDVVDLEEKRRRLNQKLSPNRALTRHKLEAIAWEKTPRDYRGSSGSRREVLINTTEGTTLVPLGELTDYQLRRYIGPTALEEAGDMRSNNGSGTVAAKDLKTGDMVCLSGTRFREVEKAKRVGGKIELWVHGAGTWHLPLNEQVPTRVAGTAAVPAPRFELGDRVSRVDDPTMIGTIGFMGGWQGEEYGGYQYKVDWDNGAPRHFQPEDKLMRHGGGATRADFGSGARDAATAGGHVRRIRAHASHTDPESRYHESHKRNASRGQADEVAARELSLYIENEYSLIGAPNSQGKAIEKNLEGHLRRGNFDLKKAEIAYMHLMESGAKKYAKEFASERDWHTIFNVPTRELVAHEFATTFVAEHKGS